MAVYLLSFILSIVLIWVAQNKIKSKKIKILLIILSILPLLIVSAIRYDLGTDYTKRYTKDYLQLAKGKDVKNLEIGFKLIDYFCLLFTKEPYVLFVITSLIILVVFFVCMHRKNTNMALSLAIFFLGRIFLWIIKLGKAIYCNGLCINWLSIFDIKKQKNSIYWLYNKWNFGIFNAFNKYSLFYIIIFK